MERERHQKHIFFPYVITYKINHMNYIILLKILHYLING